MESRDHWSRFSFEGRIKTATVREPIARKRGAGRNRRSTVLVGASGNPGRFLPPTGAVLIECRAALGADGALAGGIGARRAVAAPAAKPTTQRERDCEHHPQHPGVEQRVDREARNDDSERQCIIWPRTGHRFPPPSAEFTSGSWKRSWLIWIVPAQSLQGECRPPRFDPDREKNGHPVQ